METGRILAFGAHAADPFLAAGGTLAKHSLRGDQVVIVCLTYGERSHAFRLWEEKAAGKSSATVSDIKNMKKEEAKKAAEIIGADVKFLDFEECPLVIGRTELKQMVEVVREVRPTAVLTHWIRDWVNPDHAIAGESTLRACQYSGLLGFETTAALHEMPPFKVENIFHYTITPMRLAPEIGFIPDCYIDIENTIDKKIAALREFKTQSRPNLDIQVFEKHISYYAGYRCHALYAETFKRNWSPPQAIQYLDH